MKYKPGSDYIFECEILCSGLNAKDVEDELKNCVTKLIKSNKIKNAMISNDSKNARDSSLKLFTIIEELQKIIGGEIIHIGRIPDYWKTQLKKEMEEKDEMDKKRLLHLDDCIMIVTKSKEKNCAVILDRRGLYSISLSPPK